jgi:hypothetical protein
VDAGRRAATQPDRLIWPGRRPCKAGIPAARLSRSVGSRTAAWQQLT